MINPSKMKDQFIMTKEFLDYHILNAQSGNIQSLWLLGLNYLRGDATDKDYEKAYSYFKEILL